MSRNWNASDNPPRHFKPTARHLRDMARLADAQPGEVYVSLAELAPNAKLALAEGIARFASFHPTSKKGI